MRLIFGRPRLIAVFFVSVALATLSLVENQATKAQLGDTTAVVAITQTPSVNPTNQEIDAAVRQAVELAGGLPENIGPGKKVVIQPNLVQAGHPMNSGVTTHPQVIRTIIAMCLEAGVSVNDITICEGSASFLEGTQGSWSSRAMTQKAFRDCGLDAAPPYMVEDVYGVKLVDANDCGTGSVYPDYPAYSGPYNPAKVTRVVKPGFLINRVYMLPNPVVDCDVLIRVPVLKNHNLAGITGALKLAFGIAPSDIYHYPGLECYKWALLHQTSWGFNELETNARGMVDMTLCRPPDLVVTDGLVGIMNGPVGGPDGGGGGGGWTVLPPEGKMHCILASRDPVAIDTIHTLLCGYNVSSIPSLQRARDAGLGTNDPAQIEVRGVHVASLRRTFVQWGCAQPNPDRTGPTVSNINVPNGTYVCGGLVVKPTSSPTDSGSGVCKAELRIDGVLVDSNHTDYSTVWIPTDEPDGTHTLTYTVYDRMLNETNISRTIVLRRNNPIGTALGLTNGTPVALGPVVYTGAASVLGSNVFFISSESGLPAMRVAYSSAVPLLAPGQRLFLQGTISSSNGSRYLSCTSMSLYDAVKPIRPFFMTSRAVGGGNLDGVTPGVYLGSGAYNVGVLITIAGKVSSVASDCFYVDDGSLAADPSGATTLKIRCGSFAKPAVGSFVVVTGWCSTELDNGKVRRVVVARSETDIVVMR
ncbi:MAG: DUF362 domain-containing protein [Armatimonadota bacterium]|nr:DUF362 domain-containing protein [Armatimonadota bacterium]